jgi:hypothetical protein
VWIAGLAHIAEGFKRYVVVRSKEGQGYTLFQLSMVRQVAMRWVQVLKAAVAGDNFIYSGLFDVYVD